MYCSPVVVAVAVAAAAVVVAVVVVVVPTGLSLWHPIGFVHLSNIQQPVIALWLCATCLADSKFAWFVTWPFLTI